MHKVTKGQHAEHKELLQIKRNDKTGTQKRDLIKQLTEEKKKIQMANKCAMNWASQVREISTKQGDIFTTIKLITQAIPVWRKQGQWESHKEPRRLARSIRQLVMLPIKPRVSKAIHIQVLLTRKSCTFKQRRRPGGPRVSCYPFH